MAYEDEDKQTVAALEEIKAVLRKYDLWAAMTVISKERVHWLYHFEPSWSCLHLDPATGQARMKAKAADFATPEQQHAVVEQTTGAILSTRDAAVKQFADMSAMSEILTAQFKVEHTYSDLQLPKAEG